MLKAKNKNVVDIIFNNKHAIKVYKGVQLVWQKIAEFLHLTQVCGNSVQESPNLMQGTYYGGLSGNKSYVNLNSPRTESLTVNNAYGGLATYFKAKPNTTYFVSGNVEGHRYAYATSYTSFSDIGTPSLGTILTRTIDTPFTTFDNTEYIVVSWTHNVVGTVITFSDIKAIESNVQPSPSNPIEIKSVGDKTSNLWGGDLVQKNKWISTSGAINFATNAELVMLPIVSGATYYYTSEFESSASMKYRCGALYDENQAFVSGSRVINTSGNLNQISINTSRFPTAKYIAFAHYQSIPNWSMVKIDDNSRVYEPYGYKLSVDVNGTISTCYMNEPLRRIGQEWDEIYRDDEGYHIERRIYEDSDSATKPMEQGLHLLDESIFEDIEWDVEPLIPVDTDIVFLSEVQPIDYIVE